MSPEAEKIAATVEELIPKPEVSLQINACLANDNSSVGDVVAIVERDPALTARLMKIANSAFYGYQGQLDTLNRAVVLIGLNGLRDLVWACESIDRFNQLEIPKNILDQHWGHGLFTALCARTLATKCRMPMGDRLFVTGMLHDIGLLALWQYAPQAVEDALVNAKTKGNEIALELRHSLGLDHFDVGAALLGRWHLPGKIVEVIAAQSDNRITDDATAGLAIIRIANYIAHRAGYGYGIGAEAVKVPTSSWQEIGLSERIVEAIEQLTLENFDGVKQSFLDNKRGLAA